MSQKLSSSFSFGQKPVSSVVASQPSTASGSFSQMPNVPANQLDQEWYQVNLKSPLTSEFKGLNEYFEYVRKAMSSEFDAAESLKQKSHEQKSLLSEKLGQVNRHRKIVRESLERTRCDVEKRNHEAEALRSRTEGSLGTAFNTIHHAASMISASNSLDFENMTPFTPPSKFFTSLLADFRRRMEDIERLLDTISAQLLKTARVAGEQRAQPLSSQDMVGLKEGSSGWYLTEPPPSGFTNSRNRDKIFDSRGDRKNQLGLHEISASQDEEQSVDTLSSKLTDRFDETQMIQEIFDRLRPALVNQASKLQPVHSLLDQVKSDYESLYGKGKVIFASEEKKHQEDELVRRAVEKRAEAYALQEQSVVQQQQQQQQQQTAQQNTLGRSTFSGGFSSNRGGMMGNNTGNSSFSTGGKTFGGIGTLGAKGFSSGSFGSARQ